jgi:hypothetical protein
VRRAVVGEVVEGLATLRMGVTDLVESPITGADGNVEYLARARADATPMDAEAIDRAVVVRTVGQTES